MDKQSQIAENVRPPFCAPVEVRWVDQNRNSCSALGTSVDVSLYGLGIVIPVPLAIDTLVTVQLNGVPLFGDALVRYSQPAPSGFRIGLQFRLSLFLQDVPGLDEVLASPLRSSSTGRKGLRTSLFQWIAVRLWKASLSKNEKPVPRSLPALLNDNLLQRPIEK